MLHPRGQSTVVESLKSGAANCDMLQGFCFLLLSFSPCNKQGKSRFIYMQCWSKGNELWLLELSVRQWEGEPSARENIVVQQRMLWLMSYCRARSPFVCSEPAGLKHPSCSPASPNGIRKRLDGFQYSVKEYLI